MGSAALSRKDYFRGLGLSRDPFSDLYEPDSYLCTAELQQRLELSKHLLEFSHQLLLIRGQAGVGKTVFGKYLVEHAEDDWLVCQLEATESIGPDQLVKSMLQGHADILDNETETIASIDRYLEYCHLNAKIPVLLIDNAQLIERNSIKFLLQLIEFRHKETFVRVVLIAEDSFLDVLNEVAEEQSNNNLVHAITIPVFNLEQTETYINHRLQAAGAEAEHFSNKEIGRIFKVSAGVAGDISFLAKQGLSDPAQLLASTPQQEGAREPSRKSTQLFKLMSAAAVLTVLVGLFVANNGKETSDDSQILRVTLPPPRTPPVTNEKADVSRSAEKEVTNSVVELPESEQNQLAPEAQDERITPVKEVAKAVSAPATIDNIVSGETNNQSIPEKAIVPEKSSFKNDAWLLAQAGSSYVLQLIGATEMKTISRFVEEAGLDQGELALYRTSKSGRDWYVLVYGVYPDLPTARAAIKGLPARAQAESPWAKSMLVIHKALKAQ